MRLWYNLGKFGWFNLCIGGSCDCGCVFPTFVDSCSWEYPSSGLNCACCWNEGVRCELPWTSLNPWWADSWVLGVGLDASILYKSFLPAVGSWFDITDNGLVAIYGTFSISYTLRSLSGNKDSPACNFCCLFRTLSTFSPSAGYEQSFFNRRHCQHAGFPSSHLILRLLHSRQPPLL